MSVTHKIIAHQLMVHTPWGPEVLNPQRYARIPGSETVVIVDPMTLDKLALNLNNRDISAC